MNSMSQLDLLIVGGFSPEEEEGLRFALTMVEERLRVVDGEDRAPVYLHAIKALRRCLDLPD